MLSKTEKLSLLYKHPEFFLEVMTYGAENLLHQMLKQNLVKKVDGQLPNRATCHPAILQQFKRNIELSIEIPNG